MKLRRDLIFSSADHHNRPQEHMLSFSSSNKSETPYICKDGGAFPSYQPLPSSYSNNAAAGSLVSSNMLHGHFAGIRGPFTPSQWSELQQQALIYKYITASVPVPSNLLIPIKRSFNAYGLSYASDSFGWGTFHLGFSGHTDAEPGRCRRTDGKKWRCSRDAVADQKYCERHINRGRHRSRKPVEGQTGHAASNSKVVPPMSSSVKLSLGGASNNIVIQQHQLKNVQPGAAAISPSEALVNRMQEDSPFPELTPLEFGLVSSDSLLNPSESSPFMTSKDMGSFLDFSNQESQDQHPLGQFMDDWPKDQLKPDWTQLSMSIPMALSDLSPEKPALAPLRLSHEVTQKHTNWWESSMGGPLGEVLTNSLPELNLLAEGPVALGLPGSSPRDDILKTRERTSFFNNVLLASSLASPSIPSL